MSDDDSASRVATAPYADLTPGGVLDGGVHTPLGLMLGALDLGRVDGLAAAG